MLRTLPTRSLCSGLGADVSASRSLALLTGALLGREQETASRLDYQRRVSLEKPIEGADPYVLASQERFAGFGPVEGQTAIRFGGYDRVPAPFLQTADGWYWHRAPKEDDVYGGEVLTLQQEGCAESHKVSVQPDMERGHGFSPDGLCAVTISLRDLRIYARAPAD